MGPSSVEEFERRYAERAGVTVEYLRSIGRYGQTCDCGAQECEGFAMGHQWEDAIVENQLKPGDRFTMPGVYRVNPERRGCEGDDEVQLPPGDKAG